jgi:hypothetical protein
MSDRLDSEDRSMARRLNFLGFPGEKRGGLSYAGLKAELGDENAAALVTKIGTLLETQGLDKLGVPMHHAVDRIVQSLTPDERRTIAEGGGLPPRVQTKVSAEIAMAKAQQSQTVGNIHASAALADGLPGARGALRNIAAQGTSGSGSSAGYDGMSGKLSTAASSPEFLRSLGLDYGTASKLAGLGFTTPEQVRQIAQDANTLGLAPKAAAVDIAKLRKAEGKDVDQHINTLSEYGTSYEDIERERKAEDTKPDSPEKTQRLRVLDQRRKDLEQQTDSYEHNQVHTQEGRKQFHRLKDMSRDAATLRAKVGADAIRTKSDKELKGGRSEIGSVEKKYATKEAKAMEVAAQDDKATLGGLLAAAGAPTPSRPAAREDKPKDDNPARQKTADSRPAKPPQTPKLS